jgi:hypothetical protein
MRICLALLVIAACTKPAAPDWKLRTGEGFTVEAPYPAKTDAVPAADGTITRAFVYSPGKAWNIEVLVSDLPANRTPAEMLALLHAQLKTKGTVYEDRDLPVGTAPAFETRLHMEVPGLGKADVHERVVVYGTRVFQVIHAERDGEQTHRADGDRFVDSFKVE